MTTAEALFALVDVVQRLVEGDTADARRLMFALNRSIAATDDDS